MNGKETTNPEKYLTRTEKVIGLKFDHMGRQYVITSQCPSPMMFMGKWENNLRMDKYWAAPTSGDNSSPNDLCVCIENPESLHPDTFYA